MSFRHSRGDDGTSRDGQKTYGSVFGMIFLGVVGPTLVVDRQWIATKINTKKRKTSKKSLK
jgi:hypothetical protein